MNYFATLRDEDVFPDKIFPEVLQWTERKTVKIILRNDNGQIALVTNPVHKCYLLPGGGIDEGEDVFGAGDRECQEEVQYSIKNPQEIGTIEEYRARDGKHYETHGLIADVKDKIEEDLRMNDEKKNDLKLEWHAPAEVIALFDEQLKRLQAGEIEFYNTGFNIIRDRLFFHRIVEAGHIPVVK